MKKLRIATRQSALALWQSRWVAEQLEKAHPGLEIELVEMTTEGDRNLSASLSKIGGKGLFLKELEQALLENRADIAVHSLKDVPANDNPGLKLCAFLPRATPWDALLSNAYNNLADLPPRATVGTSSLRRQAQLLAIRPDLNIQPLRGNVDTRINKLQTGQYDAIILAAAGLERLNLQAHIREYLSPDICLPAVGQGIVVVQAREDDADIIKLLEPIHHETSFHAALAERSMNAILGGSCQVPVAGFAKLDGDSLQLHGLVAESDGTLILRATHSGKVNEAEQIGEQVANHLLEQGAGDIIETCLSGPL